MFYIQWKFGEINSNWGHDGLENKSLSLPSSSVAQSPNWDIDTELRSNVSCCLQDMPLRSKLSQGLPRRPFVKISEQFKGHLFDLVLTKDI